MRCDVGEKSYYNNKIAIIASPFGQKSVQKNTCSASIQTISSLGNLTIEFSEKMNSNYTFSLDKLNSDSIDIYVDPYKEVEDPNNKRNINLTWSVESFEE